MEAPSEAFLLFFLLHDWLELNHLKSRMECGLSDIFSRHICSTVAETTGVTNYAASFGAKKCSENHIWSCWDNAWSVEPTIQLALHDAICRTAGLFCINVTLGRCADFKAWDMSEQVWIES